MPMRYEDLRSARWFTPVDRYGYTHRERMKQAGFTDEDFRGKPVIGVFSTWSELNPCHIHLRERAEDVKRGIWQAGGFPLEVPMMSLGEPYMKPTTMLYRDMLAMQVEEMLRCHPLDGVVLMGGCDKTTPAMLMGALAMNLPAIYVPAGPMLTGRWRGQAMGSGTDVMKATDDYRAGRLSEAEWREMEAAGARSPGHCMTMGTASTMTSLAEALGMTLSGASSIPAPDSRHRHMASLSGRRIVGMVWEDLKPRDIVTRDAFENAIVLLMALGGSTNAVIHLLALANRAGVALSLDDIGALSDRVPVIANLKPSGAFLMEDLFHAGGLRGVLETLRPLLRTGACTVTGRTLGEDIAGAPVHDREVIRPLDRPLSERGALVVLRGNLAPEGCVIKRSAASPHLMRHTGRAVVFRDRRDLLERIDDPALEVDADSVLVLQNCGPVGVPGMPEWGPLPIPRKLLRAGVTDMVRVSDARMSGTLYGTIVLHVSPEAAVGGPLALVRDGDAIELDVERRALTLHVADAELARRRSEWQAPAARHERGWARLYADQVRQAHEGAHVGVLGGVGDRIEPLI